MLVSVSSQPTSFPNSGNERLTALSSPALTVTVSESLPEEVISSFDTRFKIRFASCSAPSPALTLSTVCTSFFVKPGQRSLTLFIAAVYTLITSSRVIATVLYSLSTVSLPSLETVDGSEDCGAVVSGSDGGKAKRQ